MPAILLALLLSLQAHAMTRKAPAPAPIQLPATYQPALGPHPFLVLKGTVGATGSEIPRLKAALDEANHRLASQCLRDRVVSGSFTEDRGLGGAGIYSLISKVPSELSVEVFDGTWKENHISHTVAYEGTGAQIRLNRYYLGTAESIGATYVHERLGHGYGFTHFGNKATSVPYGLQYALEGCK